ncbi:hypothetical protein P7C70_g976, partial [Phenoliferia sp. Uapishka_3]
MRFSTLLAISVTILATKACSAPVAQFTAEKRRGDAVDGAFQPTKTKAMAARRTATILERDPQFTAEAIVERQFTAGAIAERQFTAEAIAERQFTAEATQGIAERQITTEAIVERQFTAEATPAIEERQFTAEAIVERQFTAER